MLVSLLMIICYCYSYHSLHNNGLSIGRRQQYSSNNHNHILKRYQSSTILMAQSGGRGGGITTITINATNTNQC